MGSDFGFNFNFKCCICNKETDLYRSTYLDNLETNAYNDTNGEDNQKENAMKNRTKSKSNSSNEPSIKNFKGSVYYCPQQNNDNDLYNDNGYNCILVQSNQQ